ncbi:signal recognition particle GTPase [Streptomyces clavuligerus]|nr:signal recognition particle GTPase [Streptomyces clavuligerus]
MQRLDPRRPARDAWVLLGGYPFARAGGITIGPREETMLAAARHRLWRLRRHRVWEQYLEIYRQLPKRLRGYRIEEGTGAFRQVVPAVAPWRFEKYDAALEEIPGFSVHRLTLAPAGRSVLVDRGSATTVTIPAELIGERAPGHALTDATGRYRGPLTIPREQLAATARWMDERIDGNWLERWDNLELAVRDKDGFREGADLRLDSLLHLVGMVGAGKSTLMILIAVWAATRGEPEGSQALRTTLVVGDVAEQLRLLDTFRSLGLRAVPVLGPTTRETHVQRLHRRLASQGEHHLLRHDATGFDDLSTVCVVDALRDGSAEPLRYAEGPCSGLHPLGPEAEQGDGHGAGGADGRTGPQEDAPPSYRRKARNERRATAAEGQRPESALRREAHGCPLWSACPRHGAAREQVEAEIWIANPWSLVSTSVSAHLNTERLRQLELACLRSDIVVVDEADQVQMTFDRIFAPSATLVTQGLSDSWLDQVQTKKIDELAQQGRLQLTDRDIAGWDAALSTVVDTTNRIYALLIADPGLRAWVDIDYFNTWTLQEKLLSEWFPTARAADDPDGTPDERLLYEDDAPADDGEDDEAFPRFLPGEEPWAERRDEVRSLLDRVRDDPLGNDGSYGGDARLLLECVNDLLHGLNDKQVHERVLELLDRLLQGSPCLDGRVPPPRPRAPADPPKPADLPGSAEWHRRAARRLSFTLLLYALERRLDRLTRLWPQVEAALHLDATGNELSRKPPLDYAPLIPESPMGNVLGFQYLVDTFDHAPDKDEPLSGTLRFFRCAGIGRELLLGLPRLGNGGGPPRPDGPRVLLMSGTSWAGTSTRAHVLAPVGAILKPNKEAQAAIRRTVFRTGFLYEPESSGKALSLSGKRLEDRPAALAQMVRRLADSGRPGLVSPLEEELKQITDPQRNRALLLVGSYRDAAAVAEQLHAMKRWRGRVRVLTADDAELDEPPPAAAEDGTTVTSVRRGDLASFAQDPEAQLLVAPLLAVERGHNILNRAGKAAFGTVFFLARPHPRADDLYLSVYAINDWACRFVRDRPDVHGGTFTRLVAEAAGLDEAGQEFRRRARAEWRRLVSRRYVYSRLEEHEKVSFAWDQLVTLWQVIGRLVRGGVPARVVFVDAAFAPALADEQAERTARQNRSATGQNEPAPRRARRKPGEPGLLPRLRLVLEPYFTERTGTEAELVRTLYEPLYEALASIRTDPPPRP